MKFSTLLIFLLLGFVAFSCKDLKEISTIKDDTNPPTSTLPPSNNGVANLTINTWIHENMDFYYLWTEQLPAMTTSAMAKNPDDYFKSLLYKFGEVDRFSWIQDDAGELTNSLGGVTTSSGINFSAFYAVSSSDPRVTLAVRYVIKNSPAEKAGIKRGDFITKVNGEELTTSNYGTALAPQNLTLTLGEKNAAGHILSTTKTASLTKEEIQNDPIQHYSIIEAGTKKVGYIVYTQFIPGKLNSNAAEFDNGLRRIFGEFKTAGVSELVLDLRFNGGGYISSSNVLSSLIVKDLKPGTLMSTQVWSSKVMAYLRSRGEDPTTYFGSKWLDEPNNLGSNLQRVFILTSNGTASASELVINNLLPHMEVILVGANSYGKDVGSITIDDKDNKYRWKWGMQPIVLRTVNSKGEANYGTKSGFTPNVVIADNQIPYKPFGDPSETYLSEALKIIGGSSTTAYARISKDLGTEISKPNNFDNRYLEITDMYLESAEFNKIDKNLRKY